MRVLVTGIAGFVGTHLVDFLQRQDPAPDVFGLVKPRGTLPDLPPEVTLIEADLEDAPSVERAMDSVTPDRIVHLAAQSSPQLSWADPAGTFRTNVLGLMHVLEAVRKRGLAPRTLVVGSAEEYGLADARDLPLREDAPLRPQSPYASSKVAQGYLALQYTLAYRLPIVRTRTFHHTGSRRGEAFAESSFARQLVEIEVGTRPPVVTVGNLDAVRDFTDVRDVLRAYWLLLDRGLPGEVYNVCSGRGVRIGDLLDLLIRLSGIDVEVRLDPQKVRRAEIPEVVGDPSKIRAATGWQADVPLERTLRYLLDGWRERLGPAPPAASR
ncbi:MAG TPA: GDP-mannose 4,6-dehydratase [Vicinamibacteria bacterium]|nr:GDP-mannose 4,6-dehydratase [Vicinamibacteria bacterium]